jgi:hypothetical protein
MSKIKKINRVEESDTQIDYDKLRLDVLKSLADGRGIECKPTKDEIIKNLKLDDEGKYIRPVTYQKQPDGSFIIGISINDSKSLVEIGKMVEKNIAKNMSVYSNHRLHYTSKQKLS